MELKTELVGRDKELKSLELGVEKSWPMLLVGDTGTGKTRIVYELAKTHKAQVTRINLTGETGIPELLGKYLLRNGDTFWQNGALVDALVSGKWVILDEINGALPEILFVLNSLLDDSRMLTLIDKDHERISPHENFRLFATMNPPAEYTGTKELNKALLSRFPIVINFNGYSPEEELKIVLQEGGVKEETGRIIVDVANGIRQKKQEGIIYYTCSTRDLIHWAKVYSANGHTLKESFEVAVLNKTAAEEKKEIQTAATTACLIEFNWAAKEPALSKKLTADLAITIEEMKKRRDALQDSIQKLQTAVDQMREVVEK